MKKKIILLVMGLLLAVSACSGKKNDRIDQIRSTGVLHIAIVDTDSIYTNVDGMTPMGLEPELAETIAQALGVNTEYQVMTRSEALEAVSANAADIAIGCINASDKLASEYQLSTPYGKGFFYAVTKKGDYTMTAGAFEDSSVGVDLGLDEKTREQLYRVNGVQLYEYGNVQAAEEDILNGRIRAYICYENQARLLAENPKLQVQDILNLEAEEFVIVMGKENQSLASGINILIQQFLEKE